MTGKLVALGAAVFLLNLPFGMWRSRSRKFSVPWFVAIHAPVPAVVALRFLTGVGYQPVTFPVLIGAYFAGQFVGGRLSRSWKERRAR
jgi:hypothetical protein